QGLHGDARADREVARVQGGRVDESRGVTPGRRPFSASPLHAVGPDAAALRAALGPEPDAEAVARAALISAEPPHSAPGIAVQRAMIASRRASALPHENLRSTSARESAERR